MEAKDSFLVPIFQLILSIFTNMEKNEFRLVGVMSGTSLDGIDLVFTEIDFEDPIGYKIIHAETVAYTEKWQSSLENAIKLEPAELNDLDYRYTEYLSGVINTFIKKYEIDLVDAVCSHGHTVKHRPKEGITFQIGNLPELARLTGIPVVCDFRVQDVELGGQGAPLVPIGDRLFFSDHKYCMNLGGFANISMEKDSRRLAFDICPVNTVLNFFTRKIGRDYDENGNMAASGEVNEELLQHLNALSFYKKEAPKSLGIEWVNCEVIPLIEKFSLEIPDILSTFCVHVAQQTANVLDNDPNSSVLLTGGGVYNEFLMGQFRKYSKCEFLIPDAQLVEFKEALIFALLGALKLRGEVNVLQSVTGARMDHSSGRVYEP